MGVGVPHALQAREGGDQHEQRGAWEVKVGEQTIDDAEAIAGCDEEPGFAASRAKTSVLGGASLQRPHHGGADGDHAAAPITGARDRLDRVPGQVVTFGMHSMIVGIVGADREEGPGADMQGDERMGDAALLEPRHQRVGEMQRRGRRGHGTVMPREPRLIVPIVGVVPRFATFDVGRKRHAPVALQRLDQAFAIQGKAERNLSMLAALDDLGREARADVEAVAQPAFSRRLGEGAPGEVVDRLMQGQLDPGFASPRRQTGGKDAGVVEDQEIVRLQQVRQIGDVTIIEAIPCYTEKAGHCHAAWQDAARSIAWRRSPVNTCAKARRSTSKAACKPANGRGRTDRIATPRKSSPTRCRCSAAAAAPVAPARRGVTIRVMPSPRRSSSARSNPSRVSRSRRANSRSSSRTTARSRISTTIFRSRTSQNCQPSPAIAGLFCVCDSPFSPLLRPPSSAQIAIKFCRCTAETCCEWAACGCDSRLSGEEMRQRQVVLAASVACVLAMPAVTRADQFEEYLDLSLEDLLSLEVSSVSKKRESLQGAAAAVHVISNEDIRRSGATSIPELLRMVPGVNVAQINSRSWAVSVRGFLDQRADKLLVLMDGRTLYSPLWGGVNWDAQQTLMEDIERIEIIRGPGATVWGANAVNGVINIITKSAADTDGTLISAAAGGEALADLAVRHAGDLTENTRYRVFARGFERDSARLADGSDADDAWDFGQLGFRVDRAVGPDRLMLEGGAHAMRADAFSPNGTLQAPATGLSYEEQRDRGAHLLARWERSETEDEGQSLQFFVERSERTEIRLVDQITTVDVEYQQRHAMAEHDLLWGVGYRHIADRASGGFVASILPPDRNDDLYSAFVQDEIQLVPEQLSLTVGSKLEHNDYTGWEWQPSLRLAWTPDQRSTWWGAVSRAVHTPTRYHHDARLQIATQTPGGPLLIHFSGNPDFQSEELLAWELGYRKQASEQLRFDAAFFYNEYSGPIGSAESAPTCQPSGTPPPCVTPGDTHMQIDARFVNGFDGHSYGGELAVNWQAFDWWQLAGSYSALRMDVEPQSSSIYRGQSQARNPRHQLSINSSIRLSPRSHLDAQVRYVDELAEQDIEAYTELDMRFAWRPWDGVELSLAGRNLLDDQHTEFASQEGFGRVIQVERSVHAGLHWEF